jgi:hypothetical protein
MCTHPSVGVVSVQTPMTDGRGNGILPRLLLLGNLRQLFLSHIVVCSFSETRFSNTTYAGVFFLQIKLRGNLTINKRKSKSCIFSSGSVHNFNNWEGTWASGTSTQFPQSNDMLPHCRELTQLQVGVLRAPSESPAHRTFTPKSNLPQRFSHESPVWLQVILYTIFSLSLVLVPLRTSPVPSSVHLPSSLPTSHCAFFFSSFLLLAWSVFRKKGFHAQLLPLSTDPTWSPPRGPSGQLLVRWF